MMKYTVLFVLLMLCFGKSHAEDYQLPDNELQFSDGHVYTVIGIVEVSNGFLTQFNIRLIANEQIVGSVGVNCSTNTLGTGEKIPANTQLEVMTKHFCGMKATKVEATSADALAAAQFLLKQEKASKAQVDAQDQQRRQREEQNSRRKAVDEAKVEVQELKAND